MIRFAIIFIGSYVVGDRLSVSASIAYTQTDKPIVTNSIRVGSINAKAKVLAKTLDDATEALLDNKKSPSRKVGELDNRGSHYYLALYWAQALAAQDDDSELKTKFAEIAEELSSNETKIIDELNDAQGDAVDIGGYYCPDDDLANAAMRPSDTFNSILAKI